MFNKFEMEEIPNALKMDDLYQTLPNGKKVLDFVKIKKLGYPINIIFSERGAKGKSTNAKKMSEYERKLDKDYKMCWIRNTDTDIKGEVVKFLEDVGNKKVKGYQWWSDIKEVGSVDTNSKWFLKDNKEFIKFQTINQAHREKGSRVIYGDTIWDECNISINKVSDVVLKFDSLLHSGEDIVSNYGKVDKTRLWMFGNFLTLNHPIFFALGLTHITKEIHTFSMFGYPFLIMICPKMNPKEREEFHDAMKKSWRYQMSLVMNTADHSYYNESFDEVNAIKRYTLTQELADKSLMPLYTLHCKKEYINIYKIRNLKDNNYGKHHVIKITKPHIIKRENGSPNLYIFNKRDVIENAIYRTEMRDIFYRLVAANKITFEDVGSRELFIQTLR